ncbi:MAG TPA: ATP-binding cassette domain-containing protein, partial [Actinopolymorphaceae bacterium]
MAAEVLRFDDVDVWVHDARVGRTELLKEVRWRVHEGECWALLGPNGAGKSTLLSLAGALRHPSRGAVGVLGARLGRVDVRDLRAVVGNVNPGQRIPDRIDLRDYVLTGATGTVQPLPRKLGRDDEKRADEVLELLGLSALAGREIAVCSQGERARARIARALVPRPRLLLLDEATSALDLPSREEVLASLETLVAEEPKLALVV